VTTTELVPIYFPKEHYAEGLNFLASLLAPPPPTPPLVADLAPEAQTRGDVDRGTAPEEWWPVLREVTEGAGRLMVALAQNPETQLSVADLAKTLGTEKQVRSALVSLTKRMKKFGLTKWPFEVTVDPRTGLARYEMTTATAIWVREFYGDR